MLLLKLKENKAFTRLNIAFYKHSQENTKDLLPRESNQVFFYEYCKNFKNSFFYRNLSVAAIGSQSISKYIIIKYVEIKII